MAKNSSSKSGKKESVRVVCRNRRARHDYHIFEQVEAGIALTGTETKSLRSGMASLEDSFIKIEGGEAWLMNADIPEYAMGNRMNHKPKRPRKLLLHRAELEKLSKRTSESGFTLIPLRIYFPKRWAKVEVAVARGKKEYDKREALKARDDQREIRRAMGMKRSGGR